MKKVSFYQIKIFTCIDTGRIRTRRRLESFWSKVLVGRFDLVAPALILPVAVIYYVENRDN